MKKSVTVGIVSVMLVAPAMSADAFIASDNWLVGIRASYNGLSEGSAEFGTQPGSLDTADPTDSGYPPKTDGVAEIICYDLPADPTLCADGRWAVDKRAPLGPMSGSKVWDLKAYLNGVPEGGDIVISAWVLSSAKITSPDVCVRLWYGTAQTGTLLWTAPYNASGTSASPQFVSANYPTAGSGVQYFTFGLIPAEPSGVAAMLAGIVGLVGLTVRRRK